MSPQKMKRTNLYLSVVQLAKLDKLSRKTGLSVSELMRRAIDQYLESEGAR
jgi:predicted DNA-binding protein